MKFISERISYHRHNQYTTILVSSKVEKWKESLLFGWMIMWIAIGTLILYLFITGKYELNPADVKAKSQQQLFLLIFMVFWAYYLYRIIKIYLWRKKGVEYFKIDEDSLLIKRAYGKYGKAKSYFYSNMGEINLLEKSSRSFSWVMQSSFWDIGNEALSFESDGKEVIFGIQLENTESKKLKDFLKTEIKRRKVPLKK